MYWEFHERGFHQSARIGDWKGVRLGPKSPIEVYNIREDPGEKQNVADQHPEVAKQFAEFFASARVDSELWPVREKPARARPRKGAKRTTGT